ncbi:HNH endonuclease family protein [Nitrosomonas sp. Nm166]|uniref:HNH endonuclease family protein n=1 Tax=Nitrosomonas sp. Nm166 TaxID=1881054 RepID=UPI000B874031|nr:HNH endonuclease family protein [Nitrosomonas sp. Nm166]
MVHFYSAIYTPPANSDWVKWFPDEDERDDWTHRLANLVPLHVRKNPAASNYDFATKKNVYFKGKGAVSPFVLTQEVRSEETWTSSHLTGRQERLVGVLKAHWNLEVATDNKTADAVATAATGGLAS